jgi:hypothetical protein
MTEPSATTYGLHHQLKLYPSDTSLRSVPRQQGAFLHLRTFSDYDSCFVADVFQAGSSTSVRTPRVNTLRLALLLIIPFLQLR